VDPQALVERARAIPMMEGSDLVKEVTCAAPYDFTSTLADAVTQASFAVAPLKRASRSLKVAAYDYGIKLNILHRLAAHGCEVRVYPAHTPASEVLAWGPDGVFLSNGPGDPAAVTYAVDSIRTLLQSDVPMFGICLGHQLLGLAMGASTFKLKFGHRGANHLYDGTVEGLRHVHKPVYSVQYHPEASPGPHDADYLFTQFIEQMEKK
jgi:carbamoyl-phosphate synthase small subunit